MTTPEPSTDHRPRFALIDIHCNWQTSLECWNIVALAHKQGGEGDLSPEDYGDSQNCKEQAQALDDSEAWAKLELHNKAAERVVIFQNGNYHKGLRLQRWAFTSRDLENPAGCHSHDELYAQITDETVIVYRDGTVSDRYADGTKGVTADQHAEADACETLSHVCDETIYTEETEAWRQVYATDAGDFAGFDA